MLSVNSGNTFPSDFGVPNILIAARVRGNCILTPVFFMQKCEKILPWISWDVMRYCVSGECFLFQKMT